MSDDKPWEDFPDPITGSDANAAAAPAGPSVGYGEDIAKGTAGGLGRGVAGTLGIFGTAGNLFRAGLSKVGVPDEYLDKGAKIVSHIPQFKAFTGPDSADVQHGIEAYTGKFYEPKTIPGQYASTLAEFAPSALMPGGGGIGARVFNTIVPALASETAGQYTKGTAAEPWARGVAGLVAGPLAGKLVTPTVPPTAQRAAAVGVLDREGVPLTAGERTGSKAVRWLESTAADMPGSGGRAQDINSAQANALDRAFTDKVFDPAQLQARGAGGLHLPDPDVVVAGKQSLGNEYDRLSQNNALLSDPQLHTDFWNARNEYDKNVLPSQRTKDVEAIHNDLVDNLVQGGGQMPGDVYQTQRSRLGKLAASTTDVAQQDAFDAMKKALDDAMQRNLSPADRAAWQLNNRRYANMKQIMPAVAGAGENLSPARMAQAVRAGRPEQYAARSGDLDELANAASTVIKPLPNSGTGARLGWQQLFSIPAMLGSAGAGFGAFGPAGALIGAAAPFATSRAALSKVGQAYLGNQALPQNARDAVTQALMQQATTQPSGIARNQAERAAYEQKRIDDRRNMGLD